MDKYRHNCDYGYDKCPYSCKKCKKLEAISEDLTKKTAELNKAVEEKIAEARAIQEQIEELERKAALLRIKEKEILEDAAKLDEELDQTAYEAFKYLYATIDCYKKCKDHNDKPDCCCKCCCRRKHHDCCEY